MPALFGEEFVFDPNGNPAWGTSATGLLFQNPWPAATLSTNQGYYDTPGWRFLCNGSNVCQQGLTGTYTVKYELVTQVGGTVLASGQATVQYQAQSPSPTATATP